MIIAVTHRDEEMLYFDMSTCQNPFVHNLESIVGKYNNSLCRVDVDFDEEADLR